MINLKVAQKDSQPKIRVALADNAVRKVVEGTADGTISVTTGTGAATDVAVHGLGSSAYTDSTAYATAAQGTKADSAIQSVTAKTGDKYITATPNGTSVEIASKGIDSAIQTAADAVKVSVKGGGYITGSTDDKGRVITLGSTTQTIANASSTAKGLAEASDVKGYVDDEVSKINTATETLGERVGTLESKVGSEAAGETAATGLFKGVADNNAAIATEKSRATEAETALSGRITTLEGAKHVDSLGGKTGAIAVDGVGGEGTYKVKLAMTDQKLGATITGLGTAAAKDVGDFDAAGAANGVKTELVGTATEGYKTLGDLEAKIKNEASRADAAEKVNAKAISDETTRAKAAEKANADAIAKINGTGEGSFAKGDADTLASAKTYADEQIKTSVSSVYKVKGTKATFDALPTEGNVEGDVWNVTAAHGNTPAGTNYVWVADGETGHWDPLGGTIDLSPYAKSADVAKTYATQAALTDEQTRAEGKEKDNADAIAAEVTRATDKEAALLGVENTAGATIYGAKKDAAEAKAAATNVKTTVDTYTVNGKKISTKPVLGGTDILVGGEGDHTTSTVSAAVEDLYTKADSVAGNIDSKITAEIQKLDVTGNKSEAVAGIAVTVNETDGKVSKPIVEVTPGSVAAGNASVVTGGAVYTAINDALVWHDIA